MLAPGWAGRPLLGPEGKGGGCHSKGETGKDKIIFSSLCQSLLFCKVGHLECSRVPVCHLSGFTYRETMDHWVQYPVRSGYRVFQHRWQG